MAPALDADQRYLVGVDLLQAFAMLDRNQHVPGSVNNIGMAVHIPDPFVRTQVIAQHITYRQYRQEALHNL